MEVSTRNRVNWRNRRLIVSLYMGQKTLAMVNNELSESSEVGSAVRGDCLISPLLFNVSTKAMMREALSDMEDGVNLEGN